MHVVLYIIIDMVTKRENHSGKLSQNGHVKKADFERGKGGIQPKIASFLSTCILWGHHTHNPLCTVSLAGGEDGAVQATGQGAHPCQGEHGGGECQDQRATAGVHLTAQAGGVRARGRHGVRDAIGRPTHPGHLRDLSPSRLGPAHQPSTHTLQDDRQENVSNTDRDVGILLGILNHSFTSLLLYCLFSPASPPSPTPPPPPPHTHTPPSPLMAAVGGSP